MVAPSIEVVSLTDLRLDHGTCDVCKREGWVALVILSRAEPLAFYICDSDRRELIEKLAEVS